jgi:hypothetical protein
MQQRALELKLKAAVKPTGGFNTRRDDEGTRALAARAAIAKAAAGTGTGGFNTRRDDEDTRALAARTAEAAANC